MCTPPAAPPSAGAYPGSDAFNAGWYGAHPDAWHPAGWTAGQAWGAATWPAVGAWYGWGAATQPTYYDYGNNVSYQGNQVYYGNQPVATADQYYQQAATLAQSQPLPDPKSGDWMPLGVFGLVQGIRDGPALRDAVGREQIGRSRGQLQ